MSERKLFRTEQLRLCLREAAADGLTPVAAAEQVYKETNPAAVYRIVGLVARLRRRGVKIVTHRDSEYRGAKYILAEFVLFGSNKKERG